MDRTPSQHRILKKWPRLVIKNSELIHDLRLMSWLINSGYRTLYRSMICRIDEPDYMDILSRTRFWDLVSRTSSPEHIYRLHLSKDRLICPIVLSDKLIRSTESEIQFGYQSKQAFPEAFIARKYLYEKDLMIEYARDTRNEDT
jgi:hypothetical protein